MEGYILRDGKEQLTLSTAAADKLLQSGQGDAALLYLALCQGLELSPRIITISSRRNANHDSSRKRT